MPYYHHIAPRHLCFVFNVGTVITSVTSELWCYEDYKDIWANIYWFIELYYDVNDFVTLNNRVIVD